MKKLLLVATLVAAPLFAAEPRFTSNDVKYKDTSVRPATGRAGDAAIEAYALLGRDGKTGLTVTANGSIDKVQVKIGDLTTNFHTSGNMFSTTLTGLVRRTPIDVQVNVSGADPARTGVVSATETVKMRPELSMQWVTAPPHALAGAPTHISADLGERWGDTGARTNCVLLKDGVEIDRAENIWVNARSTVTCEFATVFPPGSGTVNLQVNLADTMPADYDPRNDISRPFQIQVYDRLADIDRWHASGFQSEHYYRNYTQTATSESENITDGRFAEANFHAFFRAMQPDVTSLRASLRVITGDRILFDSPDIWFDQQPREETMGMGMSQQCAISVFDENQNYIRACNVKTTWDGEYTTFNYTQTTGDVTYVSRGWYALYAGGPPAYVWYTNQRTAFGSGFELGDTLSFDVQISDGTNYWAAQPTLTMETTTGNFEGPYTCIDDPTVAPWCYQNTERWTVKRGFASGGTE